MATLKLSEIWIYPIKSLGGIRLSSSRVEEKGLPLDRRWMLIDESGVFMTQRIFPKMALFKVALGSNEIDVRIGGSTLAIPLATPAGGTPVKAVIWDDTVEVVEVNEGISAWFSANLETQCRLVSFPKENSRPVDPRYRIGNENVSLADAYPFLIIGEQSLADLNERMKQPLPMNRFRPNFVFSGGLPYEEDGWGEFRIGKNRFVGVKPCARCAVPTINQETAEKGIEPLATLATYRKKESKVLFGQNIVARDHYEIYEGDEILLD